MSLPGIEIPVSSWSELTAALHSRQLVQFRPDEGGHLRSPYVFRGADATWDLLTSIQRIPRNAQASINTIEHALVRNFRKYANAGSFDDKSEWYVLAVGQHNGLPTRCLDWSSSPLVAAHFACGKESHKKDDGVILCLHAGILSEINERIMKKTSNLRKIAWVYDTHLLGEIYSNLSDLDASRSKPEDAMMLLWEPPSLDSRIANQSGLLSLMNSPEESQNSFLQTHASLYPDLVTKIVIKAAAKSEIRDMLDQNNISERTIFPGLPGLCGWLTRYYGKAW